jgi:hypothetical protein
VITRGDQDHAQHRKHEDACTEDGGRHKNRGGIAGGGKQSECDYRVRQIRKLIPKRRQ